VDRSNSRECTFATTRIPGRDWMDISADGGGNGGISWEEHRRWKESEGRDFSACFAVDASIKLLSSRGRCILLPVHGVRVTL